MNFDLSSLNAEQMKPVLDTEGKVLVTAGAGSGKTRLLTHRIAHIVSDLGVIPYNILAITFTNKAANEMRERLNSMMDDAEDLWVFTFHSLCVRILRKFIDKIGYKSNFSIYDESAKEHFVKGILKKKEIEEADFHKTVISHISDAKNEGKDPDEYMAINKFVDKIDVICEIYAEYEQELKRCNSLDFDDLLIKAYKLLLSSEEARTYYQDKFHYIHVDEFQDTNTIQYKLIMLLAQKHGNILCVGDEDQSIYGWRGANFKNIFDFSQLPGCKTYRLEQNYRCTKKIIDLANKVISINKERLEKVLWTDNESGTNVEYFQADTDGGEADYVIKNINYLVSNFGYKLSDFAILMRVNSLTRVFEERLIQYNIPHKIYGGFKFYDRKEIKDMLAYLKFLSNHDDFDALERIINFPKRGIGEGTLAKVHNYALVMNESVFDCIINIEENQDLPNSVIKRVLPFSEQLKCMVHALDTGIPIYELLMYIVKVIGLKEFWAEDTSENESRKDNVKELISSVKEFEDKNENATIEDYLQTVSLYSDIDDMDQSDENITLATIHSAKGLEFRVVFIVGLEDGIFPNPRANDCEAEMEEERRLMYVAITRAKKRLFLTSAKSRFRFGKRDYTIPSSFLKEMGFIKDREPRYRDEWDDDYGSYRNDYYQNRSYSYKSSSPVTTTTLKPESKSIPVSRASDFFAKKKQNSVQDVSKYKVGMKVSHKRFGQGVIVNIKSGSDTYADIEFESVGKLTLLLTIAQLQIIE